MKRTLAILLALCMVLTICVAGAFADKADLIKVGIINNDPNESGYRTANDRAMRETFTEENGYEAIFFNNNDAAQQIATAQQMIQDEVDYLLLSPASTTGWDTVLADAAAAGTQVILFDRMLEADESMYVAAVVSDMAKEGETAVAWLVEQALEEYKIIHIQGHMGSDAQIGRTGALDEKVEAEAAWSYVTQQTADWDEATAKTIVESVINSGEAFNVIYAENDGMARGAVAALDAAGITHGINGDVIVMGFDCNSWALQELLDGNWNYDGQCNPFQAEVVDSIIKDLENGIEPAEKVIYNPEQGFDAATITAEDVATFGI